MKIDRKGPDISKTVPDSPPHGRIHRLDVYGEAQAVEFVCLGYVGLNGPKSARNQRLGCYTVEVGYSLLELVK